MCDENFTESVLHKRASRRSGVFFFRKVQLNGQFKPRVVSGITKQQVVDMLFRIRVFGALPAYARSVLFFEVDTARVVA